MNLIYFSVENYKIFKEKFEIRLSGNSMVILTGRNNTGKSTVLEAINRFYQNEGKPKTIQHDCFSNPDKNIEMFAEFYDGEKNILIKKVYENGKAPSFYDKDGNEIKKSNEYYSYLEQIFENKPFYITPAMLPEHIQGLIQDIYKEIIGTTLNNLNSDSEIKEDEDLRQEYFRLRKAYPNFLRKIKDNTDKKLKKVSESVTENLQSLFSNKHLGLKVVGGESTGFTSQDIIKTTTSIIEVANNKKDQMPLENQGTGLQRMSLIYLIQNMIKNGLLGEHTNKLILIDEPEVFLHPEAIRSLSNSLYEIGEEMPLIISTHSPILIDLSKEHSLIQVFRVNENMAIELYQTEKSKFDDDDFKNLKILNYVDSYVNEFFFASEILIVEGDTEYIVFKHLSRKNNVKLHIIRARGKDTIVTLMKVLNQFNTSYKVLHDVDNNQNYEVSTLKGQKTKCQKIFRQKENAVCKDNIEIYVSDSNFEQAVGLEGLSDSKKTRFAFEMTQENLKDEKFKSALRKVEDLFNFMYNEVKEFKEEHKFRKVENIGLFDDLFESLISESKEVMSEYK